MVRVIDVLAVIVSHSSTWVNPRVCGNMVGLGDNSPSNICSKIFSDNTMNRTDKLCSEYIPLVLRTDPFVRICSKFPRC